MRATRCIVYSESCPLVQFPGQLVHARTHWHVQVVRSSCQKRVTISTLLKEVEVSFFPSCMSLYAGQSPINDILLQSDYSLDPSQLESRPNDALTLPLHAGAYVWSPTYHCNPRPRGGLHSLAPSAPSTLPLIPPCSPSHSSTLSDSERKNVNTSIFSMSSAGQATSSTSNVQFIIDAALAEYTEITGTDLSQAPFAAALEQSNSPEVILQLLQERERAFKEFRDGNRRLMKCVSLAVKVIQPFSRIIREAVGQVCRSCHPVTLLTVASSDPLPTNECSVRRHRYSPCCMSLESDFQPVPCDE